METAELITNSDPLNRRLTQADVASSPFCLKQNYLPAHLCPVIKFCQPHSGFIEILSTFFRTR
ncbi:MAG: hypothetical protein PHT23_08375, partial [Bacteroidales bacterium]|nr:hypothetical protein [Bacteroidales bacterium]